MLGQSEDDHCLTGLRGTGSQGTDPRLDKKRIEQTKGGLLPDSYRWILDNDDFRRWRNDLDTNLLWIKGDPGKGKTMLLCGIVDELESTTAHDRHNSHLAYFFCQAADSRLNNATAVLRGLVYLLVEKQRALLPHVRKKYDHAGIQLFEDRNAWVALSEILANILRDSILHTTCLIIDALDECEADSLKLLDFIVRNSSVSSRVKWIVSSRNWLDIEEQLKLVRQGVGLSLELNAKSVSVAVKTYIEQSVRQLVELKKYDRNTEDAVRNHLTSNAHNTFLWVALVCERLKKITRRKTIAELNEFPPGLNEFYDRMIAQVYGMEDQEDVYLCKRILAMVAMAYRPLTLDELAPFIDLLDNGAESLPEIIGICGSFLVMRQCTIYFVHQSAKDFLLTKELDTIFPSGLGDVHRRIFSQSLKSCSLYSMSKTLKQDICNLKHISSEARTARIDDSLKAISYMCCFWVDHLAKYFKGNPIDSLFYKEYLGDEGPVHFFLLEHLLHWFEALSLFGEYNRGILAMFSLECLISVVLFYNILENSN